MKYSRRNFFDILGIRDSGFLRDASGSIPTNNYDNTIDRSGSVQDFNMCGFRAPKLSPVRIGFIGLGNRGPAHLRNMLRFEGVEINGICDLREECITRATKLLQNTKHHPAVYVGKTDDWKRLCERNDIDVIYIATPWNFHTPMALYAMAHGKHVCVEVPAATTLEECWQLVEASEKERKHCMMLENDCYAFFQMFTLNLSRHGFFGEIVHGEGAYIHNLTQDYFFNKKGYWEMWRLRENIDKQGNLYPTHGLGPICQIMNINRGEKLEFITSASGSDFTLGKRARELAEEDSFFAPYVYAQFRGNMNSSLIKTNSGRTILLQHDVSSPNVYSRIHKIVGTKGTALEFPLPGRISNGGEDWLSESERKSLEVQYEPPITRKVGELARNIGGHGGSDFILDWRTIDCLSNGLPLDQDVYDAALWSSIVPLSRMSVADKSGTVKIPDFTRGSWKINKPVDTTLKEGGNTKIVN